MLAFQSNILSYGFEIKIQKYENERVYQYIPNKNIAEEFVMCDLFIHSPYLRQHTKMINKQQYLFKYETDNLLSSLQTQDERKLIMIAKQLMEAICVLHQHNIPGRCFNISNILWNEKTQKLTLMEFGLSSPLIIYPPELLNQKYRCYGIEIDQFLIGCVIYELYFKKPIQLQEKILDLCFRNLNIELSKIPSKLIRELLIGTLQFNLSKRIQFKDLAELIGCNQNIVEFYSQSKKFKLVQNIIDQKIFFRESRNEENSTYILTESALMQSLIMDNKSYESSQESTQESFYKTNNSITTNNNTLMKNQLKLEKSKFQCFDAVLSILGEFNQDVAPELSLTILAINFGKIYFQLHLIKELENDNSLYFYNNKSEMNQWQEYKSQNQQLIREDIQKIKNKLNIFLVSYNRDDEIKCVQQQIYSSQSEDQEFLQQQLYKIQFFKNSLSFQDHINKFLDGYRIQCLNMVSIISENLNFTMHIEKAYILAQGLLLCAFADILFKPQLQCHQKILKILNVQEISSYDQFVQYIKSDKSSFLEWQNNTIKFLKNHEIGRQYDPFLNKLL